MNIRSVTVFLLDRIDIHLEVSRLNYEKNEVGNAADAMSAQAYRRVLKQVRTIADLAGSEMDLAYHKAEQLVEKCYGSVLRGRKASEISLI
jgi:hypothetical protein